MIYLMLSEHPHSFTAEYSIKVMVLLYDRKLYDYIMFNFIVLLIPNVHIQIKRTVFIVYEKSVNHFSRTLFGKRLLP